MYVCVYVYCPLGCHTQPGSEVFKLFSSRDSGTAEGHRNPSGRRWRPAVVVPDLYRVWLL